MPDEPRMPQKKALYRYESSGAHICATSPIPTSRRGRFVVRYADTVKKPALVLDIDETSLSNWPALKANDFAFLLNGPCDHLPNGPCGLRAWDAKSLPTRLFRRHLPCSARRGRIMSLSFFLTGPDESLRAATEKNLRAAGYRGYAALIMRPRGTRTKYAADYKAPRRKWIESDRATRSSRRSAIRRATSTAGTRCAASRCRIRFTRYRNLFLSF